MAQGIHHWETIVEAADEWSYHYGSAPDPQWQTLFFNDILWSTGPGGIGYGDGDDSTTIPATLSVYIRHEFSVLNLSDIELAVLNVDYDDGFVAYLNGVEIAREGLTPLGQEPSWNTPADGLHEAELYQGGQPEAYVLNSVVINNTLQLGYNVLALQVHNESLTSSDLTANAWLSVGVSDTAQTFGPTPDWFEPVVDFTSSDLPIVVINSGSNDIVDEPSVLCDVGIIWDAAGGRNYLTDPFNDYNGKANVEYRGQSSQAFPKKGYRVETTSVVGLDSAANLIGLPREEDWVLHGPYSDKTLMRNVLAMHIHRGMGHSSSRTRFCELVVNNVYQGVYVLMEKIKRDDDRVDIARLSTTDIAGDELTGGYIFKIDKGDVGGWYSEYGNVFDPDNPLYYQYVYPKPDSIQPEQTAYIQSYMDSLEAAMAAPDMHFAGKHYSAFMDVQSFADYVLLQELSKNVDGYRLSTYFYKDRTSKGGKIVKGPVWDFNLGFYNADHCESFSTAGWMYGLGCGPNPEWYSYLMDDPHFQNQLHCRWEELRAGVLDTDSLMSFIQQTADYLDESQQRNFVRWPIIGEYIWPNPFPDVTEYIHETQLMAGWIEGRLAWMDSNLPGNCTPPAGLEGATHQQHAFQAFPNPNNGSFELRRANALPAQITIFDCSARVVQSFATAQAQLPLHLTAGAGLYVVRVTTAESTAVQRIVVR